MRIRKMLISYVELDHVYNCSIRLTTVYDLSLANAMSFTSDSWKEA